LAAHAGALIVILLIAQHLLSERIQQRTFPDGDEGSWMAVASQLAKGEGFTTRWLEHPFLVPYALPRPDDFRYPALTLSLAAGFRIEGLSYQTGLWVIELIFMLFLAALFILIRQRFDAATAIIAGLLAAFSLLQLYWNTQVYTEGLFALVLAGYIAASTVLDPKKAGWWIVSGIGIGLLYLVRPNAIVLSAGPAAVFCFLFLRKQVPARFLVLYAVCQGAVMSPWLIRAWIFFGNPFHVAAAGGMLSAGGSEPINLSFLDFIRAHGVLYPAVAAIKGCVPFFTTVHDFEHGLEIVPLALAVVGAFLRVPFFNASIAIGFAAAGVACCYASGVWAGPWAGVRYYTAFLPFVYAYGVYVALRLARKVPRLPFWIRSIVVPACIGGIMLAPVYYPHRCYERVLRKPPARATFADHVALLNSLLAPGDAYYANQAAQLNFLTGYRCVGMQRFFDSTEATRAQAAFHPRAMVLKRYEVDDPRIQSIIRELRRNGVAVDSAGETSYAVYYRLSPDRAAEPPALPGKPAEDAGGHGDHRQGKLQK